MCDTKHAIAWENSKIITTNNRYGQRRCLEAWHINMNQHALNRDDCIAGDLIYIQILYKRLTATP